MKYFLGNRGGMAYFFAPKNFSARAVAGGGARVPMIGGGLGPVAGSRISGSRSGPLGPLSLVQVRDLLRGGAQWPSEGAGRRGRGPHFPRGRGGEGPIFVFARCTTRSGKFFAGSLAVWKIFCMEPRVSGNFFTFRNRENFSPSRRGVSPPPVREPTNYFRIFLLSTGLFWQKFSLKRSFSKEITPFSETIKSLFPSLCELLFLCNVFISNHLQASETIETIPITTLSQK